MTVISLIKHNAVTKARSNNYSKLLSVRNKRDHHIYRYRLRANTEVDDRYKSVKISFAFVLHAIYLWYSWSSPNKTSSSLAISKRGGKADAEIKRNACQLFLISINQPHFQCV